MKKVGFVTYNQIGNDAYVSGWHDGVGGARALLVQNTRGRQFNDGAMVDDHAVADEVRTIWATLESELPNLDHVVVYVGDRGSEGAISQAARLTPDKVTFVMCSCNAHAKVARVRAVGLEKAHFVRCDCGGHMEMKELVEEFLATGTIKGDCTKPHSLPQN